MLRGAVAATPTESRGTFVDGAGTRHPWRINAAHLLIWDNKPFVPVGGLFQARSWGGSAPTEADWEADVAALATLKAKNVTDLYVQPARGGITGVKPEAIQRLLDYLDQNGFTYGISLNDGPREPLIGYVVRPGAFRQVAPESGGLLRFPITDLGSSLYFLVSASNGEVVDSGSATLVAEGARVTLTSRPGSFVVFLLPEKIYFPGSALGIPNVWEGFDGYRDALLGLFSQVKPGRGFRFFVDALPPDLALKEKFDRFIPSGSAFASEWAAWLSRRYKSIDAVMNAWGVQERDLLSIAEAADIVPLWSGGKGIEAFYSKTTGRRYKAMTAKSAFWNDLAIFKTESLRGYMNDLATALKRGVADVPVVYRSAGYSPLFAHLPVSGGFDGIGIDAYGRGRDLVSHSAGYVYAQAAEAAKTIWLPVTATSDTRAPQKPEKGYPSRAVLFSDLDWLREIGARGFYVDGLRIVDPARANFDLSSAPDQLGWLSDYARMVSVSLGSGGAGGSAPPPPAQVFYPRAVTSITPRPLSDGGWWLPTDRPATLFDFGASGRAYALNEPEGIVYYLWNASGPRKIRLRLPKASRLPNAPRVQVSPASALGPLKKDILTLTIGPEPIRIVNLPNLPVPIDAVEETAKEAKELIKLARKRRMLDAERHDQNLTHLLLQQDPENPWPKLSELQAFAAMLRVGLRTYAWIEAEHAVAYTFDEIDDYVGASNNHALMVGPRPDTASAAATATYTIDVNESGTYQIWAAATPGAPLTFRMDSQPLGDTPVAPQSAGSSYSGGRLIWTRFGPVTLTRGRHTLEMRADGPATVDTLLLIRGAFVPDGINPPPVTAQ